MTTAYLPGMGAPPTVAVDHDREGDEWYTPPHIAQALADAGDALHAAGMIPVAGLDLDPCAAAGSPIRARHRICRAEGGDGLVAAWEGDGLVYCNPPYSDTMPWMARCREAGAARPVVAMLPARTDTRAWWRHVWQPEIAVVFVSGRIRFVPGGGEMATGGGKFASAMPCWWRDPESSRRLAAELVAALGRHGVMGVAR